MLVDTGDMPEYNHAAYSKNISHILNNGICAYFQKSHYLKYVTDMRQCYIQILSSMSPKIQVIMPKVAVKIFSPKLHCVYAHLCALLECSQLTLKLKFSAHQIEPCQSIILIQF